MSILELIILAVGLSMDAVAVSVCKGLTIKNINYNKCIKIALYFGIFQGIMPLIGWFLGNTFSDIITKLDHWIAFGHLTIIGINLIKDIFSKEEQLNEKIDIKTMIPLSIATSIDALAVGITFSLLEVKIINAIILIFIITTLLSFIGVKLGNKIGNKLNNIAKILGGIILIIIGIKILIDHLT